MEHVTPPVCPRSHRPRRLAMVLALGALATGCEGTILGAPDASGAPAAPEIAPGAVDPPAPASSTPTTDLPGGVPMPGASSDTPETTSSPPVTTPPAAADAPPRATTAPTATTPTPTTPTVAGIPAPSTRAGMKVGTNFWDLAWGIWDDTFAASANFTMPSMTARLAAPAVSPWRSEFVQEVSPYAAMRFMDFGETNNSPVQHWSERTPREAPRTAQTRLAYEWMIDLCNRTHKDMWVTIPHLADQDYGVQLATLIRDTLDPSLKVYVEWSNETWNGQFQQTHYAYDQGRALGLDADPWKGAFMYHVYAAVRLFAAFEGVFGAHNPRLVKVLAGQSGNAWVTGVHLAALADPRVNPNGVTADAYAIAPYFGRDVDGNASDAVDRLRDSVQRTLDEVAAQYALVHPAGLQLIAYEGGQHVLNGAQVINARPEMYGLYQEYLNGLAPYLDLFMHYVHNGHWSSDGAWGAVETIGQPPASSPKLHALFDWIGAH